MVIDNNGELLVTYSKKKEKEARDTLSKLGDIINKHFPEESVIDLKSKGGEDKQRDIMSRDASVERKRKEQLVIKPVGLSFVLPLVKNANYMVENSYGIQEPFI